MIYGFGPPSNKEAGGGAAVTSGAKCAEKIAEIFPRVGNLNLGPRGSGGARKQSWRAARSAIGCGDQ